MVKDQLISIPSVGRCLFLIFMTLLQASCGNSSNPKKNPDSPSANGSRFIKGSLPTSSAFGLNPNTMISVDLTRVPLPGQSFRCWTELSSDFQLGEMSCEDPSDLLQKIPLEAKNVVQVCANPMFEPISVKEEITFPGCKSIVLTAFGFENNELLVDIKLN